MSENEIAKIVVDAAIHVHRALGPGLLLNFNSALMRDGIVRAVNGLEE